MYFRNYAPIINLQLLESRREIPFELFLFLFSVRAVRICQIFVLEGRRLTFMRPFGHQTLLERGPLINHLEHLIQRNNLLNILFFQVDILDRPFVQIHLKLPSLSNLLALAPCIKIHAI